MEEGNNILAKPKQYLYVCVRAYDGDSRGMKSLRESSRGSESE